MHVATQFAALSGHYLDTPTMGVGPAVALQRMHAALEEWSRGGADFEVWERELEQCRTAFADFTGVGPEQVALLPSIVPAAAAAGRALARRAGAIVAHRTEFRSALLPILAAVGEERMRWVDGPYTNETFVAAITHDVVGVVISSVSSADGARPALTPVLDACREVGAALVVDGTQSLGITDLDVAISDLDVLLCSGYKGLLGPRGVAYGVFGAGLAPSEAFLPSPYGMADTRSVGAYGPPLAPQVGARGLDQSPAWLSWIGALPALKLLAEIPAERREQHCLALAERLRGGLADVGISAQPTDLPGPVVSIASGDPVRTVGALRAAGIRTAARRGRVRLGCHIYNSQDDIEAVVSILTNRDVRDTLESAIND